MLQLDGVYAAMLTPFDTDGRINEETIGDLVEFFICKGVSGIFPVSTAGEFIQLSEDQKRRFVDIVIDRANGRVKVTPGISSPNAKQSIEFGKYCFQAGADGVVVSAPYYYKYPPEMVESFLRTVAKGLDSPVILYNIPLFANEITIDSLRNLLEIDSIVGIKESSGSQANLFKVLNLVEGMRRDFRVMVGWDEMFLAALTAGASGCMVASGGILPEIMTGIARHYQSGELEQAARYQRLVARATEQMQKVFFPYGYKLGMQARGFDMGPFCIDVPVGYDRQLQPQKEIIRRTIHEVLQEAQA
jgi:dihydrodipicolinate synthase/N-acetylneuraminate lyase